MNIISRPLKSAHILPYATVYLQDKYYILRFPIFELSNFG